MGALKAAAQEFSVTNSKPKKRKSYTTTPNHPISKPSTPCGTRNSLALFAALDLPPEVCWRVCPALREPAWCCASQAGSALGFAAVSCPCQWPPPGFPPSGGMHGLHHSLREQKLQRTHIVTQGLQSWSMYSETALSVVTSLRSYSSGHETFTGWRDVPSSTHHIPAVGCHANKVRYIIY